MSAPASEVELQRVRHWMRRRLSDIAVIGAIVAGDVDVTGTWHSNEPGIAAFDWEHAPPD